jgi:nitrite reductase (NADH) large subunit
MRSYIDRYLMFYVRTADRLQRTAVWQDTIAGGLDHIRAVVCDDSLGLAADLEEAMARHIAGYRDEWAGVLADEVKLSRFVSFVNAPEEPDPTVMFDDSGPRKVPVLLNAPAMPRRQHGDMADGDMADGDMAESAR